MDQDRKTKTPTKDRIHRVTHHQLTTFPAVK
jgi:hypothetical protein